jgi:hypothetical protein
MNDLSSPVKNIFSKAALAMLNACARFAYNFSQGLGIKILKKGGSVVIGIDEDGFSRWFKKNTGSNIIGKKNAGGDSKAYLEGLPEAFQLDKTKWTRLSAVNGVKMQIVSRTVRSNDCDYHYWRWASFDEHGALYELSEEQGVFTSVNYEGYLGDI